MYNMYYLGYTTTQIANLFLSPTLAQQYSLFMPQFRIGI